ncbi:MAG: phenylalanyl-tRNA synthetase subunit alpha, phenylalanyl-tRNA synthetase alpha chain [Candidatus Moranbacteria bacterium GW2011_GWC1_45_18]|nr:MAG: Phenylalanine-tRNA ligase alpha subunit [Candidatus Moranbacteria bacterium GW2011_GWC2_40_12]KKT72467.1 MAG: Phenylalanine-tRNA ligase alpha subunit [Candidatus Moranbacteria bacterium GW2011_GWF1_44_4]KKT99947.1 MAG: phenylalanyl-tRNA synthetase subunit alpha, phenylalanyl-tRNA synthetase alpha chain [Candidatus Moranbacteria bacterium GW2011_GWC1_45_18]OGI24471.1 MAG: phenylalanine--tRNA ligase subunit alpha [Candidatus Moranbacteria bacterium RIFOXYA1_FULL_44_8]OGI36894.1 MAG: pheny
MPEKEIKDIGNSFFEEISKLSDERALYAVKVKYVGRNGILTKILKNLKNISSEQRKLIGPLANNLRQEIENAFEKRKKELSEQIDWEKEKLDVTLPGKKVEIGRLHPITSVYREIEKIFSSMGFEIVEGPELETDWYNFTSLNFPFDHPARDMQDTFWVKSPKEKMVLRTHTSPVQVRYMEKRKPPFRIIVPGRVYRNEATDAAHEHTLHQFEALVVGNDINVGNFKHIAKQFFSAFFGKNIDIRLRPSFFPFTEPSFEFDISCTVCGGKKCPSCKNAGWLEIGGAGMVNQNVFVSAGYPRNKYQGFAWGFGIERLAMMKYKIDDIRWFESGDLRFIKQF